MATENVDLQQPTNLPMVHALRDQALGDDAVRRPVTAPGIHCMIELYECPAARLNDVQLVRTALREAAAATRSTLLAEASHCFEPHGVTAMGLLAESHIAVHTWPEFGYAAADVFTCGETADPRLAASVLATHLGATNVEVRIIERGEKLMLPHAIRQGAGRSDHTDPAEKTRIES